MRSIRRTSWPLAIVFSCITFYVYISASAAPRDLTSEFVVPDGLEVTLWAESPHFFNPTNIDVDARGRVWVAEGVNYRGKQNRDGVLKHPVGDRIVILEDADGDGVCDRSTVFAQSPDLVVPMGIAVLGSRVVVSCSPHLFVYTDENGDDVPDRRETLLTGWGGLDGDHGLHAVVGGPDGRWYFNAGNHGPHLVTDRSGWTLRAASVNAGGPGQRSDDGRIWVGGLALRVEPDGTRLAPLAHNFRNCYEIALDSFGNLWQSDNDDEIMSCRTSWILEGGSAGFCSADGTRTWRADRRPGQPVPVAHWHQEDPGVFPAGDVTGPGGPTGVVVYEGDLLPPRFRGMVLDADAGRNTIFGHVPHPEGAGFRLERTTFLSSRRDATDGYVWHQVSGDRSTFFRPSDVAAGTDGAVYVADWYDPIVGGGEMHETKGYGRILRIAPRGGPGRAPRIDLTALDGQIAALASPAVNVRWGGAEALRRRGAEAVPALRRLWTGADPRLRARALWTLAAVGDAEILREGFRDADPNLRVAAFRAARRHGADVPASARDLARDPSAAVRREIALALRDLPTAEARAILPALAETCDGRDRWYVEALGIAAEGREGEVYADLLRRLGPADPLKWTPGFAAIAWRLHPKAAVPAWRARADDAAAAPESRAQALTALGFTRDASAADAMVELAATGPEDVRGPALWWATFRAGNEWRAFGVGDRLAAGARDPKAAEAWSRVGALRNVLLDAGSEIDARTRAAAELAGTPEGGRTLLRLAGENRLAPEAARAAADVIYRNPDLAVRAAAPKHFPRSGREGRPVPRPDEVLARAGDPARGRDVFFGEAAACSRCHAFGARGADLGPDLTAIRAKLAREALLDAVLNPSAGIAPGYEPWVVVTRDEQIYSGLLLADGETLLLRESSGERRVIPAADVAERKPMTTSLMPDNVALDLPAQDLADLLAFLLEGQP